ncbi:MAG: reactive intermediate/imine deaminase [Acidobacteria bacterium]|nr:reactive intermediate/imine deaminase [Acidobacteriota bacterium]MYI75015.1 reactive intermediate/imine deaminase [Acidobacteriota bacterium]
MRTAIETDGAPGAIGPYSQAVRDGRMLFVSGQVALDPTTGELIAGDVAAQTERVMRSAGAILAAAGADFPDVVRTTVYLVDLADFGAMNEVYARYFAAPEPARSTVQVAGLPKGAGVEIDMIAALPE